MARTLKWLAWIAAGLGALLVVVAIVLQQWLRTDDFRARVEREAAAALGVPVQLGRLSVDLFPLPAVAVDQVRLLTKPPLTVERVEARPAWGPLLLGRLEIATLVVKHAVLPQAAIGAIGAAMQKKEKAAAKGKPAPVAEGASEPVPWPRKAVLEDITWIDEAGQRMTMEARADLGRDGLLDQASFKVLRGRFAGTKAEVKREADHWPVRIDIGGGRIAGKLRFEPGARGAQLLQGQLATENVEVSALTAPSKPLTGKLQAQTTLRAEFREPGQLMDVLQTQTRFTVQGAVLEGIDLARAVTTVGLSRGGRTELDTLAGQVATQGKAVQVSNLVAASGVLAANGNVAISPAKALSGRVNVALQAGGAGIGVPLAVGGTIDSPSVSLSRSALVGNAVGAGAAAGVSMGERLGSSLKGLFGR